MATNQTADEMKIDPNRAVELASNLARTLASIKCANPTNRSVRLVAVSKLKPASDILALTAKHILDDIPATDKAHLPHLHFGENYTQELLHKARVLPNHIRWHFIGALQTNKCKQLAEQIPNLWAVESVDTAKKADALEKGRTALKDKLSEQQTDTKIERVRIYVQVNTSNEDSKSGVEPNEASGLAKHIVENCPNLQLQGLMTIGAIARSQAASEGELNQDFVVLKKAREQIAKDLGWDVSKLELSMGMSADYEDAIRQGSDEIRIGTGIFGARPPKKVATDEKHNEADKKEGE